MTEQAQRLRTEEAARYLSVSANTLINWRHKGGGPDFIRVGRGVRYDTRDLDRWLAERKQSHTSEGA